MQIHIITFSRSIPVKAFLDKKLAESFYADMKQDKNAVGSYGLMSLEIEGASQPENTVDGAGEDK